MIRAIGSDGGGTSFAVTTKNKGVEVGNSAEPFFRFYATWDTKIATWLFEPLVDQTYGVQCFVANTSFQGIPASAWTNGSMYYVEDLGPTTPGAVQPRLERSVVAAGNALGVIGVGFPVQPQPVSLASSGRNALTYALGWRSVVGRRYRIHFSARAVAPGSFRAYVENLGSQVPNSSDRWSSSNHNWGHFTTSWIFDGDGTDWSTVICADNATAGYQVYPTDFYVEDVGPNTYPALPIPEVAPAWTPVTLINSWALDDVALHLTPPRYRKIGDVVTVEGSCNAGGGLATPFILPAGFRPPKNLRIGIIGHRTNVGGSYYARCEMYSNGNFQIFEITPSITDLTAYCNFSFSTSP
jgi:hypothetical protein